ncbi:hypothetical protein AYI68_g3552 [Smittium mucronatum]|uniref:Uncharacterized protein n=1 Tax=Smittium mucronatum TaxID=133383 RepID=A0A1R0GZK5_9FUNG|nr:hypothetical protein AYI68_g3552 [Smittium mucronatum]
MFQILKSDEKKVQIKTQFSRNGNCVSVIEFLTETTHGLMKKMSLDDFTYSQETSYSKTINSSYEESSLMTSEEAFGSFVEKVPAFNQLGAQGFKSTKKFVSTYFGQKQTENQKATNSNLENISFLPQKVFSGSNNAIKTPIVLNNASMHIQSTSRDVNQEKIYGYTNGLNPGETLYKTKENQLYNCVYQGGNIHINIEESQRYQNENQLREENFNKLNSSMNSRKNSANMYINDGYTPFHSDLFGFNEKNDNIEKQNIYENNKQCNKQESFFNKIPINEDKNNEFSFLNFSEPKENKSTKEMNLNSNNHLDRFEIFTHFLSGNGKSYIKKPNYNERPKFKCANEVNEAGYKKWYSAGKTHNNHYKNINQSIFNRKNICRRKDIQNEIMSKLPRITKPLHQSTILKSGYNQNDRIYYDLDANNGVSNMYKKYVDINDDVSKQFPGSIQANSGGITQKNIHKVNLNDVEPSKLNQSANQPSDKKDISYKKILRGDKFFFKKVGNIRTYGIVERGKVPKSSINFVVNDIDEDSKVTAIDDPKHNRGCSNISVCEIKSLEKTLRSNPRIRPEIFTEIDQICALLKIVVLNLKMQVYHKMCIEKFRLPKSDMQITNRNFPYKTYHQSLNLEELKILYRRIYITLKEYTYLYSKSNDENYLPVDLLLYIDRIFNSIFPRGLDLNFSESSSQEILDSTIKDAGDSQIVPVKLLSVPNNIKINLNKFYDLIKELVQQENSKHADINKRVYLNQNIDFERNQCVLDKIVELESNNFFFFKSPLSLRSLTKKCRVLKYTKPRLVSSNIAINTYKDENENLGDRVIAIVSVDNKTTDIQSIYSFMDESHLLTFHDVVSKDSLLNQYVIRIIKKYFFGEDKIPNEKIRVYLGFVNKLFEHVKESRDDFLRMKIEENLFLISPLNICKIYGSKHNSDKYRLKYLSTIYKKLNFCVKPNQNNGTIIVSALESVLEKKGVTEIDGNDQLSYLLPPKESKGTLQLVLSDPRSEDLKINLLKWIKFSSNTLYNKDSQFTKFFIFISLDVIPRSHLEKYDNMSALEYENLVESCSSDMVLANKYYPIPNMLVELNAENNYESFFEFFRAVPGRYIYIKLSESTVVNFSDIHSEIEKKTIVISQDPNTSRLPQICFGGETC